MSKRPSIILFALALTLTPTIADAGKSKPAADTLELELREWEGKTSKTQREFVIPVEGELAGSVQLFEQVHWCRIGTREAKDARVHLDLTCYQGGRTREHVSFEFAVERELEVGTELLLGELELREGMGVQVVVTRR